MRRWAVLVALAAACGPAAETPDPDPVFTAAQRAALLELSPPARPGAPADASNRWADHPAAAALGKKLFFDTALSGRLSDPANDGGEFALGKVGDAGKVSCASCHVPGSGFVDTRSQGAQLSLGAGWVLRRTPSLLDVAQAKLLMWDGRFDSLQAQVLGPLESADEMNSSRLFVAQEIARRYAAEYQALFGPLPPLGDAGRFPQLDAPGAGCWEGACHGKPGDGAEFDALPPADQDAVTAVMVNAGKAIAAYERLLSCGPARFDAWAHGDASALTRAEQRGAALFVGKGRCVSCHSGPFLTDQRFHNVGLQPAPILGRFLDAGDLGAAQGWKRVLASPLNVRGPWSDGDDGRLPPPPGAAEEGAFRTPSLRCAGRRPSFMHTGQMRELGAVVAFFADGGHASGFPGRKEIEPLGLGERERADLVAFLRALDGPGPDPALLRP